MPGRLGRRTQQREGFVEHALCIRVELASERAPLCFLFLRSADRQLGYRIARRVILREPPAPSGALGWIEAEVSFLPFQAQQTAPARPARRCECVLYATRTNLQI